MSNIINSYRFGSTPAFSFGNALTFSNSTSEKVTNTPATSVSTFTISYWCKFTVNGQFYLFGDANNTLNGIHIEADGDVNDRIWIAKGSIAGVTTGTLSTGSWYHFMSVLDSSSKHHLYMNGADTGTSVGTTGTNNFTPNVIGQRGNGFRPYEGIVDDICYWENTEGTLTNAQDIYNSGAGADAASVISSPKWYYHLDESGSTTTATDSSGNSNNGTLTSFPASGMWNAH